MAKFTFGKAVDIHWNGYEIVGPALTEFTIPDQLYEEFEGDFRDVEPSLTWIDTNEFATLQNSVPNYTLAATSPIAIGSSTNTAGAVTKTWSLNANYSSTTHDHTGVYQVAGNYSSTTHAHDGTYLKAVVATSPTSVSTSSGTATISFTSGTALNGYLLAADGSGGSIWTPASTSGLTSVVGVSPISSTVSGGTVSVSLNASYQTAGTYVTSVVGTSPVSASGTTAITVSIDQNALSVNDASTAATLRTYVKNSSGSTITKGQVVYITGADGANALIGLASNTSDAASSKTLGIAANTMTNNAFGYVIENGQLSNIDTSGATAGSAVWLGSTPGSYQFTVPSEPNHFVYLGVVTKANVSTGEILVKVQNGYELNELHDVFTTGVSTSLPLVYNATSDGWIAQALSSVGIADNAIVTTKILDGAVTSAKLATDSVGAAAIAAGSVGTSELATAAVTDAKIAANAVTSGHIAAGAVGSAAISAGAVNTAKISSGLATAGQLLRADGAGNASFATITSGTQAYVTTLSGTGTWTVPAGVKEFELFVMSPGAGGGGGGLFRGTSVPGTNGGAAGGGGGGSGSFVYIPRYPVESGTTSYSYSLATPGTGGATISGSQGTGVTKTELFSTGNTGGNASGATTFGPYITISAATGGTGGTASKTAAPTQGTGGTGSLLTLSNNLYFENVIYSVQRGGADGAPTGGGNAGSGQNATSTIGSTVIGTFYGVHSLIANGYPIVAESYTTQAALVATVSQSGNTNSVTSAIGTVNSASLQNMNGIPGGSAGGGGANAVTTSAGVGKQGINNSGNSGGGIAVTYSNGSQGTITIVGSTGASGKAGTGGGGGGGGGTSITSSTTTANQTATGYVITSGGGGDGGTGLIFIRYIA